MPCNMASNLLTGGIDLLCWGLTFVPPDGVYLLLGSTPNIMEASHKLLLFLTVRVPPFGEALNWL